MASTAVSTVPKAVITTTGNAAFCRLIACRNSCPSSPGISRGKRRKTVLAKIQLEQAPHLGFIFDNQNYWHDGWQSSATFSISDTLTCTLELYLLKMTAPSPRRLQEKRR